MYYNDVYNLVMTKINSKQPVTQA